MEELDRRELLLRAGAGALVLAAAAPEALAMPARDPLVAPPPVSGAAGPRALRALARTVSGPVRGPGSVRAYNARFDGRGPDAVVAPRDTRDVQAVLRWADRYDVRLAPRSGGHSYAGYSTPGEGVVVDLRRLGGVASDRAGRRALVGPGATVIEVYERLARAGVTVPGGSCPSVGFGGLALGGGYGLASRALGLTADNVRRVTVVTADGRIRRADARRDPELLWACRGGGGGNFGVVTAFELRTHPARTAAYFTASFPWEAADRALAAWQAWAPETDPRLTSVMTLGANRSVAVVGQYLGDERGLRSLLGPLRSAGGAVATGASGYAALQLRWGNGRTTPRTTFSAKSDYVRRPLSSRGRRALLGGLERGGGVAGLENGLVILDAYGGAINRPDADATAFVHRDERFSIQYLAYHGADGGPSRAWLRSLKRALAPHVSGSAYQNYIDPELEGWRRAYYGENLARLEAAKRRYDPDGRFRFAQGV